jgi:hypothetical protein
LALYRIALKKLKSKNEKLKMTTKN